MKVLITGSEGFIGAHLTNRCLNEGWDVVGVDNMVNHSGRKITHANYVLHKRSVTNTAFLKAIMKDCDVVFHLAALPKVGFSIENPITTNRANVNGTLSVLNAASRAGVKRVVFSCSSSIFGGTTSWPTNEETPRAPLSPYALQKSIGADYCKLYSSLYGLDTASLVYYNVFGPYQKANSAYAAVIPSFINCAISGDACRIDGDGLQSRDFCFVDNVVDANILAAIHPGKLKGELFNIACGKSNSILDVFEEIKRLNNGNLNLFFSARRPGDPGKSLADISKAKSVLGYNPKVDVAAGLKITFDFWKGF